MGNREILPMVIVYVIMNTTFIFTRYATRTNSELRNVYLYERVRIRMQQKSSEWDSCCFGHDNYQN